MIAVLLAAGHVTRSEPSKLDVASADTSDCTACIDMATDFKARESAVFGAFRRLVSLCIVYVSSCMVMYRFLCLVPSFATVFNLYRYMRLYRLSSILDDTVSNTCVIMYRVIRQP